MNELKPCPLCGGEANLWLYDKDPEGMYSGYAECSKCEISIDERANSSETLKESLMRRWNTRHVPTCRMIGMRWMNPDGTIKEYVQCDLAVCSECGHETRETGSYCPGCGAKVVSQ